MKKLILIGLFIVLVVPLCYADKPLTITIENTTDQMIIVYIDSIDHGVKIKGVEYPGVMCVFGGEIQAKSVKMLNPREYNKSPYRYLLTICRTERGNIISSVSTIFKILPDKKEHIIIIGEDND